MRAPLLFIVASVSIQAQMTDEAGRKVAEAAVRNAFDLRASDFLHVRRAEDLEEDLLFAARKPQDTLFYRVDRSGKHLQDGEIVISTMNDSDPTSVVAVGPDGSTYRTHGFSDSSVEFNRLMISTGIELRNSLQTEAILDLYRDGGPDGSRLTRVLSLTELEQVGASQCLFSGSDSAEKDLHTWLSTIKNKFARARFDQRISRDGKGFRITWVVSSYSKEDGCGGAPTRASLHIGLDGQVSDLKFVPIN